MILTLKITQLIMNRISSYHIGISKIVVGGVRNIDSYYVVVRSEKPVGRLISHAMRLDEDNSDDLQSEVELKPTLLELWNYDKMRLVDKFKIDFKVQASFNWLIYAENIDLSIKRNNPWEEQIKNRKKEEAEEDTAQQIEQKQEKEESMIAIPSIPPSKVQQNQKKSDLPPRPKKITESATLSKSTSKPLLQPQPLPQPQLLTEVQPDSQPQSQ